MHCVFFQDTQTNAAVVGVTANNCNQFGIFMALGGASDYPANPMIAGNYISNSGGGIALTNSTNVTLGINYFYNNTSNINYGGATFSSVTTTDGYNGMVLIEPGNSGQNVALFSNLATASAYIRKIGEPLLRRRDLTTASHDGAAERFCGAILTTFVPSLPAVISTSFSTCRPAYRRSILDRQQIHT